MSENAKKLTKDENRMLLEAFFLAGMTKTGSSKLVQEGKTFAVAMLPALNRYYKDKDRKAAEFARHAREYYNTNAVMHGLVVGICLALEKQNGDASEDNDLSDVISNLKASLMGPLAGVGDSIMFNCLRVIVAGIALGFASSGSVLAPIVFLVGYGGVGLVLRYILLRIGYIQGESIIATMAESNMIPMFTKAASVLGGIMVGAMVSQNVSVKFALTADFNGSIFDLQEMFDAIAPGILSILLFVAVVTLVRKGVSTTKIIYGIMLICVVLAFFGFF